MFLNGEHNHSLAGKWAPHVSGLLEKGFRVIAPDLPSVLGV